MGKWFPLSRSPGRSQESAATVDRPFALARRRRPSRIKAVVITGTDGPVLVGAGCIVCLPTVVYSTCHADNAFSNSVDDLAPATGCGRSRGGGGG